MKLLASLRDTVTLYSPMSKAAVGVIVKVGGLVEFEKTMKEGRFAPPCRVAVMEMASFSKSEAEGSV